MKPLQLLLCVLAICMVAGCTQNGSKQSKQSKQSPQSKQSQQSPQSKQSQQSKQGRSAAQSKQQKHPPTPDLAGGPESRVRAPHPISLSDLRNKYPSTFILNAPSAKREVALTFDDAPDANFTPQVLDALKKANVRATFFVIGNRMQAHPDIVKRMVREGHILGNHSYTHANLPKLSPPAFRQEILKTDRLIRKFTGSTTDLVRPPYGNINEDQIKWLASQHKQIINWNVDSLDWKGLTSDQVSTNVLSHVFPGSITLQHAAGGKGEDLSGTVKALPVIIQKLRADGVKLVTVDELFATGS